MNEEFTIREGYQYTAQEHMFLGGSPFVEPEREEDWYIPQGLLDKMRKGELTDVYKNAIVEKRRQQGYVTESMSVHTPIFTQALDLVPHEEVVIRLPEIDETTGTTLKDPEVLAVVHDKEGKLISERDVTEKSIPLFEQFGMDLHLRRENKRPPEMELGGDVERG